MAFYLLVVALFSVRLHERSGVIALVLAAFAALSVAAGFALSPSALSDELGEGRLILLASVVMVVAICCASAGSVVLKVFGGLLGGALALALVTLNGTVPVWEGLMTLAVMFLGTAVYRADTGQSSWSFAGVVAAVVVACGVGSAYVDGDGGHFTRRAWIVSFLLAVATFALGLAVRGRRIPRVLTFLGTISYSVYLVHPLLLAVSDEPVGRRRHDDLQMEVTFYAVLLPVCVVTYYCIERPAQRLGRRPTRRDAPDRVGSGASKRSHPRMVSPGE